MYVELHMLQNFAPSCLNRDDTNSPKDCEFGGYRRARISSQCIKRAIREAFKIEKLLPDDNLAQRTKLLLVEMTNQLCDKGKDEEQARKAVEKVINHAKLKIVKEGKTEYLLFVGKQEIDKLVQIVEEHWDSLLNKKNPPKSIAKDVRNILDGGKASDVALFGRMLANLPEKNIDAACQAAHAISTNKVSMEFDFYTAVDDLNPKEETGAGMMGTVEFNSACFYRYANVDLEQLHDNLQGDEELARQTVEAFLRASVTAIPSGKQNSMAAQNPPSFVGAVVRDAGLWSLANAFVKPIVPDNKHDLVDNSILALTGYWSKLEDVYGADGGIKGKWAFTTCDADTSHFENTDNHAALIRQVMENISFPEVG